MKKKKTSDILLTILVLIIPIILILLTFSHLDNDLWYILSEGRYITQNGLILMFYLCIPDLIS